MGATRETTTAWHRSKDPGWRPTERKWEEVDEQAAREGQAMREAQKYMLDHQRRKRRNK